jgi:hypothetical protein
MNAVASKNTLGITAVGLGLRDELLLKSMLRIVNGNTRDRWQYRDDLKADVALCSPQTASKLALHKSEGRSSALRCIPLLREQDRPPAGTPALRAPFRAMELRRLLDEVSSMLTARRTLAAATTSPATQSATVSTLQPFKPFRFGLALNKLIERASREMHRIEAGSVILHVIPAARALLLSAPLDEESLGIVLGPRTDVRIRLVDEAEAQRVIADGAKPQTIDWLLWRAGLDGPTDQLLPGLPANGEFALKRWPDFGRLKHKQSHFLMAGLLTRIPHSVDALALASSQPVSEVCAFINACALCDLIEVRDAGEKKSPAGSQATPAAPRTTRYGSVFQSIRNALRFGRS